MTDRDYSFAIATLSVTATILLVGLVILGVNRPAAVYADTVSRAGDYIAATGALNVSEELLYLIDVAAQRLNVYRFDYARRSIVQVDSRDLRLDFRPDAAREGPRR